ncbi:Uncharacterised protein [Streptococcus pneumoniae]|nr:Uncharacterised protein [Streptococcus pneumoniae]VKY21101.1 Uncharacterised protein [Streptococcus pneumoniae]VLS42979.1 Uncharacterised protein [Streptococcus pneumoniae]
MQIFTYKDFLKDKGIITFEQAEKIYDALIKSVNIHDPEFLEDWKYLIELCARYAEARGKYLTIPISENESAGKSRSGIHELIIIQLNVIKRYAENLGNDTSWFDEFHDDRKRKGDFANYLNYVYAVNAR